MNVDDRLHPELAAMIGAELVSGERVVWLGRPLPSRYARMSLPIVLFGVPWTAASIFWVVIASGFGLFALFGVPFVLVGLGLLSAPYWTRRKALRTAYAVTDRRALVLEGHAWSGHTVRSFGPDRLSDLRRTQFPDGSGDLVFEGRYRVDGEGGGQATEIGFLAIEGVKDVETLIRELADRFSPRT